jgi:hypothetical protein
MSAVVMQDGGTYLRVTDVFPAVPRGCESAARTFFTCFSKEAGISGVR